MKYLSSAVLFSLFLGGAASAQQVVEPIKDLSEIPTPPPVTQKVPDNPPPAPPVLRLPSPPPLASRSNPSPKNWRLSRAQPVDYPPSSWVADEEGVVGFRVQLNKDGRVEACEVTESSGFPALDAKTCEIQMERGEYFLDLDDNGEPIAAPYEGQQRWEKREPEFPGSSAIEVSFDVSENGEPSNCQVIEANGAISERLREQLEARPCPFNSRSGRNIYRDENGVPIPKTVTFRVEIKVEDPR